MQVLKPRLMRPPLRGNAAHDARWGARARRGWLTAAMMIACLGVSLGGASSAHALTSSFCGYLVYSGQHCRDTSGYHSWNLVQNTYPSSSTLEYLCARAYTAAGNPKSPRRGDGCGRNTNNYYECFLREPYSEARVSWGNNSGARHTLNGFANTSATAC